VRKARDPISSLRTAIDCLPARTREAMLEGIRSSPIVVGAYTDSQGGICPMLAAHRHGGRTSFVSFARAWDRFARTTTIRRATERELRTLEHLLVASLGEEDRTDLAAAIAEHRAAVERRRRAPEIFARRLTPGRLRLGRGPQRDAPADERTPALRRANVSSPSVS
jgi:hypothetical protein